MDLATWEAFGKHTIIEGQDGHLISSLERGRQQDTGLSNKGSPKICDK